MKTPFRNTFIKYFFATVKEITKKKKQNLLELLKQKFYDLGIKLIKTLEHEFQLVLFFKCK